MTSIVTRGNAMDLHLPDESVDLVVTSPPYFGLRSYQDGGAHYEGQVGDEATPTEYLDALIACTAEWVRVLKPGGSIFVNLGDKYAGSAGGSSNGTAGTTLSRHGTPGSGGPNKQRLAKMGRGPVPKTGAPSKSLIGLPWRYAIRCIDELGLILRAEIVWAKPNGLPESVTDRVRRSHEQVFHFVKQPRYFSAVDEVREAHSDSKSAQSMAAWAASNRTNTRTVDERGAISGATGSGLRTNDRHALGKLPGSVWTIPTSPLRVPESLGIDHFAAYPPELVRRIVLGWSPREVCTACGEGRRPVADVLRVALTGSGGPSLAGAHGADGRSAGRARSSAAIAGYACACPDTTAPSTPGVVLDPFMGTGTTCLVASCYGRVGIGVDLSADYVRLARWRTTDPGERARVLGVDKPPVQVEGQQDLFGELTA